MNCTRTVPRLRASALVLVAAAWMLLAPRPSAGAAENSDQFSGRGIEAKTGDTIIVEDGARRVEVRLADVGAPQGSEYFAPGARTLLSSLVVGQAVSVTVTGHGANGFVFGLVTARNLDINLEMVRRGAAWVCWEYAQRSDYRPFESDARRNRRGLWSGTLEINVITRCRARPPAEQVSER